MKKLCVALAWLLFATWIHAADHALIVADELPAMQHIAGKLKSEERLAAKVIWQTNLPPDLTVYPAVMVYIHKNLDAPTERALIAYAQNGGKLIVLHHSISSGKRKNKEWFSFLGVSLPDGDVASGGYKWIEGVTQQVVNLAPAHYITTHKVSYPEKIAFTTSEKTASLPGFTLEHSEVYLNHQLAADPTRTPLLGFSYSDKESGKTFTQAHAGWLKPAGKGWIIYLQPGHDMHDLRNPTYERILLNALIWKPTRQP